MNQKYYLLSICLVFLLNGCGGIKPKKSDGGFYGGDTAPDETRDYDSIPDAVPRIEPISKYGNNPYKALGKSYTPLKSSKGFIQQGTASWYGKKFHGRRTSSGETYDMWAMTAAHPVLPLPTYVEVTNLQTNKIIIVKVNDRGPFLHNRIIDLSYAAAHKLGIANKGTGNVRVKAIDASTYTNNSLSTSYSNDNVKSSSSEVIAGTTGSQAEFGNYQYLLQVGAFYSVDNAQKSRTEMQNFNFPLYPKTDNFLFSSSPPYRVQVGPYINIEAALAAKAKIKNLTGNDAILISQ